MKCFLGCLIWWDCRERVRQINLTAAAALVHSQINAVTTSFKILLISEVIWLLYYGGEMTNIVFPKCSLHCDGSFYISTCVSNNPSSIYDTPKMKERSTQYNTKSVRFNLLWYNWKWQRVHWRGNNSKMTLKKGMISQVLTEFAPVFLFAFSRENQSVLTLNTRDRRRRVWRHHLRTSRILCSGAAKQYQSRSIAAHRLPKTPSCSSGACPDVIDSAYRHAGEHTQCWATLWKQVHGLTSDWAPFADEGTWTWSQNYTQTSTNLK